MLMGGGGLALLMILCVFLVYALTHTSAEKRLEPADDDYRAGSYAQAIDKYKAFLENYPSAPQASLVRVRIGLAKLRQATPTGGNLSAAVEVAEDVLKTIAVENDFKEAHGELAAMLPTIAEGLVAEAQQTPTRLWPTRPARPWR